MSKIFYWLMKTRGGDAVCAVVFITIGTWALLVEDKMFWIVWSSIIVFAGILCAINALFNITRGTDDDTSI